MSAREPQQIIIQMKIKALDGNEWQTYEMVLLESASLFNIDRHIDLH
jgi:hypothetical protein